MMLVSLACVVTAVLLFLAPRPAAQAAVQPSDPVSENQSGHATSRATRWWLGGAAAGVLGLLAGYRLGGPQTVVLLAAVLIVVATSVRLVLAALEVRSAGRAQVDVAHACGVLASQIRVGRVPGEALLSAAADCPVLAPASATQLLGGDVVAAWQARSVRPGYSGLADLARAWQVSERTGAPLAMSLEQVSQALTADQRLAMVVTGELAAPRASGKIMAVLPFCGLGMGYLIGGDPLRFLLSNPYGWACLLLGVGLAATGVLWIDSLSRRAAVQG